MIETERKRVFKAWGLSDRGLVRIRNEDSWNFLPTHRFAVLADGMGGHRAGDVAARAVVRHCCSSIQRLITPPKSQWDSLEDLSLVLRFVIKDTHKYVHRLAGSRSSWRGMGSTLCCLLFHEDSVIIGHVGDSRVYRFREGQLKRLTRDDTLARDLIDEGSIDEREARRCAERHILTQAVGIDFLIDPTLTVERVEPQDQYLLCSDGLTEHLADSTVQHILGLAKSPEQAVAELVEATIADGGLDNVTVVLVSPE